MSPSNEDGGNVNSAKFPRNEARVLVWQPEVLTASDELDLPPILSDVYRDAQWSRALLEFGSDAFGQAAPARRLVLFLLVDHRGELIGKSLVAARGGNDCLGSLFGRLDTLWRCSLDRCPNTMIGPVHADED